MTVHWKTTRTGRTQSHHIINVISKLRNKFRLSSRFIFKCIKEDHEVRWNLWSRDLLVRHDKWDSNVKRLILDGTTSRSYPDHPSLHSPWQRDLWTPTYTCTLKRLICLRTTVGRGPKNDQWHVYLKVQSSKSVRSTPSSYTLLFKVFTGLLYLVLWSWGSKIWSQPLTLPVSLVGDFIYSLRSTNLLFLIIQ